jgi:predicted nucleotide-binding protein
MNTRSDVQSKALDAISKRLTTYKDLCYPYFPHDPVSSISRTIQIIHFKPSEIKEWCDDTKRILNSVGVIDDKITVICNYNERATIDTIYNSFNTLLNNVKYHPESFLKYPSASEHAKTNTKIEDNLPQTSDVQKSNKIFVVHGHDDTAKEQVARVIEKLNLEPIILHEQIDGGKTIIDKFEHHANDAAFAVVLFTPDDIGYSKEKPNEIRPRARQNVLLEFGFFIGKLSRQKVCALYKDAVEMPSDLNGVLYIEMDSAGAWRHKLAKEMKGAGFTVDLNLL